MLDLAELTWGRYNGGQNAPIGTFINLRTLEYFQQASDGTLPQDGTFYPISTSSSLTASQIATAVNAVLGTAYTSGNFHAHQTSDLAGNPGTASDDA